MEWKQSGHEVRSTFQAFSSSPKQTHPRTHASQMAFIFHTVEPQEPSFIVTKHFFPLLFYFFYFFLFANASPRVGPFKRNIEKLIRKRTAHKTDKWQIVDEAPFLYLPLWAVAAEKALHSYVSLKKQANQKKKPLSGSTVHVAPPHNQAVLSK